MAAKTELPPGKLTEEEVRERLAATTPDQAPPEAIVEGARSTATRKHGQLGAPFALAGVGHPADTPEAEPYPRLEDLEKGTPVKSATLTGEVHPVDDLLLEGGDGVPQQSESEGEQASVTELGVAAPIPEEPEYPPPSCLEIQALARERELEANPHMRPDEPVEEPKPKRAAKKK
jgi:hypothetical protein